MSTFKHVVMWRFKAEAEGNTKEENMQKVIDGLYALRGVVPELMDVELHRDILHGGGSYDVILICTFADLDAMLSYQIHPAHMKMRDFIHKVITERVTIDYVIDQ